MSDPLSPKLVTLRTPSGDKYHGVVVDRQESHFTLLVHWSDAEGLNWRGVEKGTLVTFHIQGVTLVNE